VIFLASYKLAHLFASQNREIERNVAIHQALTAYHRVFENISPPPPPFTDLINQLHRLRNSHLVGTGEGKDWPEEKRYPSLMTAGSMESQCVQEPFQFMKKLIYSREELRSFQEAEEEEKAEAFLSKNPILRSYQNIIHTADCPVATVNRNNSNSSKQKKSSQQKNKKSQPKKLSAEDTGTEGRSGGGAGVILLLDPR
jgi:hypothetical protein